MHHQLSRAGCNAGRRRKKKTQNKKEIIVHRKWPSRLQKELSRDDRAQSLEKDVEKKRGRKAATNGNEGC